MQHIMVARIKPVAKTIEGWAYALGQADDIAVECLELIKQFARCAQVVVVESGNGQGG